VGLRIRPRLLARPGSPARRGKARQPPSPAVLIASLPQKDAHALSMKTTRDTSRLKEKTMHRSFAHVPRISVVLICAAAAAAVASPAGVIAKGPYLQNVKMDEITVCVETDATTACRVQYGEGAELNMTAESASQATRHEIVLKGLKPATTYTYQVACGDAQSEKSRFRTAVPPDRPFKFVVVGDTRSGHEIHRKICEQIAKWDPAFVVNTGDLVADGQDPALWDTFFEVAGPLLRQAPYYPCLGNHEHNANLYFGYFVLPEKERWYSFDYGNSHFIVLDSNEPFLSSQAQRQWLLDDLAKAGKSLFTFVIFHHPMFSGTAGLGRRLAAREVRQKLADIVEEYGVDVVFVGHDHNYQRTFVNGVYQVITGGGGASLYEVRPKWGFAVQEATHHWVQIEVNGPTAKIRAVRADGTQLDSFEIKSLRAQPPEARKQPAGPATRR